MKCSLCSYEFQETEAEIACQGCPLAKDCHLIKCPNCNYEMPKEPKLIKVLRTWRRRNNGT
jgi:hypothetical protein